MDASAATQAAAAAAGRATKSGTIKTSPQGAETPNTTSRSLIPITGTRSAFG